MVDIKVLGVVGSLSAVATGGGIYWVLKENQKPISISELFKGEKGWKLMTESGDAKWDEAWERYRDDHKNTGTSTYKDTDRWGISNWKIKKSESQAPEEFKKECEKRSSVKITDTNQQEYQEVKRYCSRPKKVSELLSEDKAKILLKKGEDTDLWNQSWIKYKKANIEREEESNITYKTKDIWEIEGWNSKQSLTDVPTEYKDKCGAKLGEYINPEKATSDETFKQVRSWCTKNV